MTFCRNRSQPRQRHQPGPPSSPRCTSGSTVGRVGTRVGLGRPGRPCNGTSGCVRNLVVRCRFRSFMATPLSPSLPPRRPWSPKARVRSIGMARARSAANSICMATRGKEVSVRNLTSSSWRPTSEHAAPRVWTCRVVTCSHALPTRTFGGILVGPMDSLHCLLVGMVATRSAQCGCHACWTLLEGHNGGTSPPVDVPKTAETLVP
jgi:hypothetical protein